MKIAFYVVAVSVFLASFLAGCQSTKTGNIPVLSGYKSMIGASEGVARVGRRPVPHTGIDFGDAYGAPILAAADGYVTREIHSRSGCGYGVTLYHPDAKPTRYTKYCHMSEVLVRSGENVRRGKVIGYVGKTGNSGNVPHVHFVVYTEDKPGFRSGETRITENPMKYLDGCFDPDKIYPPGELVLTSPLLCTGKSDQ